MAFAVPINRCGAEAGLWKMTDFKRNGDTWTMVIVLGDVAAEWCERHLEYLPTLSWSESMDDGAVSMNFQTPEDAMLFSIRFGDVLNNGD